MKSVVKVGTVKITFYKMPANAPAVQQLIRDFVSQAVENIEVSQE